MVSSESVRPRWILPAIVAGQWMVTSLWFATNAVIGSLQELWGRPGARGRHDRRAAWLYHGYAGLRDKWHLGPIPCVDGLPLSALCWVPPRCCGAGSTGDFTLVLLLRFLVGFFLAGVYPVGMRIAAGWYAGGLGRALGFLVRALVLGTASPHLLRAVGADWNWQLLVAGTSLLAVAGGLLVWRVPEGPHLARWGGAFPGRARGLPAAAVSELLPWAISGHMWEVYAFWAFVPVWIAAHGLTGADSSWLAFAVIAVGFVGCAVGGLPCRAFWRRARRAGTAWCVGRLLRGVTIHASRTNPGFRVLPAAAGALWWRVTTAVLCADGAFRAARGRRLGPDARQLDRIFDHHRESVTAGMAAVCRWRAVAFSATRARAALRAYHGRLLLTEADAKPD